MLSIAKKLADFAFNHKDEVKKIQESDTSTFSKAIKSILKYWYYAVLPFAVVGVIYCYKVESLKRGQKKK